MKKRNIIITIATTAVIGCGLAFAGVNHFGHSGKNHSGHYTKHKVEKIIGKMDRHLDLSDAQESSLKIILEQNQPAIQSIHDETRAFLLDIIALGLSPDDFDETVAALAEEKAEQAKQKTMKMAHLAKQVSEVLTVEQKQDAHDFIQKRMEN